MKLTNESWIQYRNQAAQFASYDHALYPFIGLLSELSEYHEALAKWEDAPEGEDAEAMSALRYELGDCFWMLSRIVTFVPINSGYTDINHAIAQENILRYSARVLRGDSTLNNLVAQASAAFLMLYLLAEVDALEMDIEDVLNANIAKLTDRAKRNVIKGEGDKR